MCDYLFAFWIRLPYECGQHERADKTQLEWSQRSLPEFGGYRDTGCGETIRNLAWRSNEDPLTRNIVPLTIGR